MHHLRIEIKRGDGWELRCEGEIPATSIDQITDQVRAYAIQYAPRALLNGVPVDGYDPTTRRVVGRRGTP